MPNKLCPKNKKNFSKNFELSFGSQKGKEKQSLYLQSFNFNDKTLLILFKAKFAYGQKKTENTCLWKKKQRFQAELFFRPTFQNEQSKKQTNDVRSFFSFCQDNMTVVRHKETFFCFTIVQNQQAFDNCLWLKKKAALFSCLRS